MIWTHADGVAAVEKWRASSMARGKQQGPR